MPCELEPQVPAGRLLCNHNRDVHMQYMLHMATLSHSNSCVTPTTRCHPWALHSDSTGPTHRHTQCQIECGEESRGQDEGVIRGRGRLLLPSSPPSVNCYRIDSQAYVSDLVSCLFGRKMFEMC